jgi:hypothetical protein
MRRLAEISRLKSLVVATTVPMIMVKPIKSQAQYITDSHKINGFVFCHEKHVRFIRTSSTLAILFLIDLHYYFYLGDWQHA